MRNAYLTLLLFLSSIMTSSVLADNAGLYGLMQSCAPTVHPVTMAAVVSAESNGHMYALADAGPVHLPWSKRKALVRSYYYNTTQDAAAKANALIAAGHTVSLGLAQINDRNLAQMGLSVESVFDPCTNLAAGADILTKFYLRASKKYGPGDKALRAALSAYNSGDWLRGEKDGYVDRVMQRSGKPLILKASGRKLAKSSEATTSMRNATAIAINATEEKWYEKPGVLPVRERKTRKTSEAAKVAMVNEPRSTGGPVFGW